MVLFCYMGNNEVGDGPCTTTVFLYAENFETNFNMKFQLAITTTTTTTTLLLCYRYTITQAPPL